MTNMTFTKGIGTPTYMSPEILNKQKCKKRADVYSFVITMYEVMKWGEAYPKSVFRFSWKIANFFQSEQRLSLEFIENEQMKEIISNSWQQEPNKRYTIDDIKLK